MMYFTYLFFLWTLVLFRFLIQLTGSLVEQGLITEMQNFIIYKLYLNTWETYLIMKKIRYLSLFSLLFAIIGMFLGTKFQIMAYLGSSRAIGMMWYWVGVFFSYSCTILAFVLMFIKTKSIKLSGIDIGLRAIGSTFIVINLLWTTFVIIAGLSDF